MERIEMNSPEASKFRALNRMVGAVAKRDLNLLNQIDETIDRLCEIKAEMDIHVKTIHREIDEVKGAPNVIDKDGSIVSMLEKTRDVLGGVHTALAAKCEAARTAPELHPEDGVVEAYCDILDSTAALHNAVNELCWAIGEHDADFDKPSGKAYTSVDRMFVDLEA